MALCTPARAPRLAQAADEAVYRAACEHAGRLGLSLLRLPIGQRWRAALGGTLAWFARPGEDPALMHAAAPLGLGPAPSNVSLDAASEAYPRVLGFEVTDRLELAPSPMARKRLGAYYTPEPIGRELVRAALEDQDPRTARVCDPACGSGNLLLWAGEELERRGRAATEIGPRLFGVDSDPVAVLLARARLARFPLATVLHGDALGLEGEAPAIDWSRWEPFDAVVANPPFGNVVEGRVPSSLKSRRPRDFPELGGPADLAYYFAALSRKLLRGTGRAALLQPRALLSARAAEALRRSMLRAIPLSGAELFEGAAVYVCLAVFGPEGQGATDSPRDAEALLPFELTASMTVAEAYALRGRLVDEPSMAGAPRLVTSGLIDPGRLLWGERPCRYLGATLRHPRVPLDALPAAFAARALRSARPKVLVAGLSRRVEAFLDPVGECMGAVSTYTITHAEDDARALERLARGLNGPEATERLRERLGPSALGGGSITVTKSFLAELVREIGLRRAI